MSTFSDAVNAQLPKPKLPPMTLTQATTIAKKNNPLLTLPQGQGAEGLQAQAGSKKRLTAAQLRSSVARQEQTGKNVNAADAAPVNDFLAHVSNVIETPLSAIGAAQMDFLRQPIWQISSGGPSAQNFYRLLKQGKLGEAARNYSTTSLAANKIRARLGDPGARYLQQHPTQFGLLGFGEEFANPGNILTGKVAQSVGGLAKAGLTNLGKTVARGSGMGARAARAAGEVATGNRFAEVRQAAADQAVRRGVLPAQAANEADLASRSLATAPQRARAVSQHITHSVFKGLTKDEQLEVVDRIEGIAPNAHEDNAREALIRSRVQTYRQFRGTLDNLTKQAGYSDPANMQGPTYFPRSGATLHPATQVGPNVSARGPQGPTLRKDTLETHREFQTRVQSIFHGRYNPQWDPAATLEQHVQTRMENVIREQAYQRLKNLGLIDTSQVDSYGHAIAPNPEFLPTEPMGSPTLKNAAVHPSIGSLIRDTTPQVSSEGMLAAGGHLLGKGLRSTNRAFAKLQVSNPLYHPIVNVSQNIAAQALRGRINPVEFTKGLLAKHPNEALAFGADVPYSEHGSVTGSLRPWSDLTKAEKLERAKSTPGKAVNAVTNRLLYKHIQPRIAEGTYRGIKGKLGSEGAALKTRQILGEPENVSPSMEGASQMAMFPHWLKAMLRYWPQALAETPALYMAPHTAVQAHNLSKGSKLTDYDYSRLIPEIITGKSIDKNNTTISPPSPADRFLGMADMVGNALTGNFNPKTAARTGINMLNPLLSLGVRGAITAYAKPMDAGSLRLWDKDAPQTPIGQFLGLGATVGKRYAPTRGKITNPLDALSGLVGMNSSERMSDARSKWLYGKEKAIREGGKLSKGASYFPGIEELRSKIASAKSAKKDYFMYKNSKVSVYEAEKSADAWYNYLQKLEKKAQGGP